MSESISAGVRFGWGLEGETKGEPSFRMTPVNSDNSHMPPTLRCTVSPIAGIATDSFVVLRRGATVGECQRGETSTWGQHPIVR
jgi:hypothetical protein